MFTDNYAVDMAISKFLEEQPIPKLEDSIFLELAQEFDDYEAPYFLYKTKMDYNTFDLNNDFSGIKSEFETIENVEHVNLHLSDEELKLDAQKVLDKFKNEYEQNLGSLALNWEFDVSKDLGLIRIMDFKPEENLTWSDDAEKEFIDFIEETVPEETKESILKEDLEYDEIQEKLDLDSLWEQFQPESKWYLYQWTRDPQTVLHDIVQVLNDYVNKLDPEEIAMEIWDLHSGA